MKESASHWINSIFIHGAILGFYYFISIQYPSLTQTEITPLFISDVPQQSKINLTPRMRPQKSSLKVDQALSPAFEETDHPDVSQSDGPINNFGSDPILIYKDQPSYPNEALKLGVEGDVILDITVEPSGLVREAVIIKGLGFGLDETAIHSMKKSKFNHQKRSKTFRYIYRFKIDP